MTPFFKLKKCVFVEINGPLNSHDVLGNLYILKKLSVASKCFILR